MKDTSALEKAEEVQEEEEVGEQQQAMHWHKHKTNGLNATAQCSNAGQGQKNIQLCKERKPRE